MVACDAYLARRRAKTRLRADGARGSRPTSFRSPAAIPNAMARAARRAEQAGAAVIDINMGCPAKRVTGGAAGCALMRDLDHAVRIVDGGGRARSTCP